MKKKKAPAWLRWAYLAMASFIPFTAWMDFRKYAKYRSYGLFSPEEWAENMDGFHLRWAIQALMVVSFLYLFAILTWDKNGDKDRRCLDEVFSTAVLLVWAILPLLISIPDSAMMLWAMISVMLVVVVGRSWIKYFQNERLEENDNE